MEFHKGQEFVSDQLSSDRHYKILSVNPVMEYTKTGKKKVSGHMLRVECFHVKEEDWQGPLAKLYDKFRFFETTGDAFEQLITRGVIKVKDEA